MSNRQGDFMPRKVKSRELDSREARGKLKPRGKPYYKWLDQKLHLGYRRIKGKSGTWWCRIYLGDRQYAVEPIGTADDQSAADGIETFDFWQAQDKARERMASRVSNGKVVGPLTVKDAVEQYLEWLESNRKSGYDARRRAEAFIYPGLGDIDCSALDAKLIGKWLAGLAKAAPRKRTTPGAAQQHREFDGKDDEQKRRRQASANRVLTILKAALNRAWREGDIPSDAEWRRVKPFESVDAARARFLSVDEANRLLNVCDPDFRRLCEAALATGCRYGELAQLQAADFHIGKQKQENGNLVEIGTIAVRKSKSGMPRHVVLTEEGAALFKRLSAGRVGHELLLCRANGEPFRKSDQARPMNEACKKANIKPRISFHGLRHTWASLSVMNNVPLLVVAKNLGHSDTRMVEKHYGHLAPSYVADAIRKGAPVFDFKTDNVSAIR
jgi:integrase